MFTNFFDNSKPINFLLVGVLMAVYYCMANFMLTTAELSAGLFLKKFGLLLLYLFLMLLLNFIVKRNQLNAKNSFAVLLFALFSVAFPEILRNGNVLLAGFFVLLALRRAISLQSGLEVKKKIFDATFWILIAGIFYGASMLFLGVVFLAVLLFAGNDYKNWLIPFVAVFTVFVGYTCFHLLIHGTFVPIDNFSPPNFDFKTYSRLDILLPLSSMLAFSLWTVVHYSKQLKKTSVTSKSSLILILGIWACSIFSVVFSPTKNGSEFLLFIIPVSIIGATYFQRKSDKIFKEVLLLFLSVMTLVFPLFL